MPLGTASRAAYGVEAFRGCHAYRRFDGQHSVRASGSRVAPVLRRAWPAALRAAGCEPRRLRGCNLFGNKDESRRTSRPTSSTTRASILLNEKKDYKEAAKRFEEVDRQHPYSEWARKALIMSAYAYYEGGAVRRLRHRGQALHHAASRQPGRRLRAVS